MSRIAAPPSSAATGSRSSTPVDRLGDLEIPMIAWANVGHGSHVQTFPIGAGPRLDADARVLHLIQAPLAGR